MHYSCKVSGGSQVGPSLSVQIYALKRLSRLLGLARRGGRVNAILDRCLVLLLSEIGVPVPVPGNEPTLVHTHASTRVYAELGTLGSRLVNES